MADRTGEELIVDAPVTPWLSGTDQQDAHGQTPTVRVVTWNIRYGLEVAGAINAFEGSATLSAADVVLLQEMTPEGAAAVADALGMGHTYRPASTHRFHGREFGNAILSRWPIVDESAVDLPHRAAWHGENRVATTATVRIRANDVSVYSAHTETPVLRLARRIEQFDRIAAHVRSRSADLVIVGGDFNTITDRARNALAVSMQHARLDVVTSRGVPTLERFGVSLTLDQVFAAGFTAVGGGVQPHEGASDHQPVWVDLKPASPG